MSFPFSASAWSKPERLRRFAAENLRGEVRHRLLAGETENAEHILLGDFLAAERDQLVEHRLGIAQAAIGALGNRVGRSRLERHLFVRRDVLQVIGDQVRGNAMEIEALAAAENGRQNFLRLGRGEDELHVRRRLLERF